MAVREINADLFEPRFDAIGHGVNCKGVMGAGIAKEFAGRYPQMLEQYKLACSNTLLLPGQVMPFAEGKQTVFNIASQYHPGPTAKREFLRMGLEYVKFYMTQFNLKTLGLPAIGCGIGGLDYETDLMPTLEIVFFDSPLDVTVCTL